MDSFCDLCTPKRGARCFLGVGEELEKREWDVKIYFLELVVMN